MIIASVKAGKWLYEGYERISRI
ncbi:hypothetical protein GPZ85_0008685 [Serratia symbiotica]|uniref:Uncharacterized protein n=1 Tax=Serratia symbiotica TaxID=138074 RepID=A0A7D5SUD1_9GAMM|nr:hypothetical protein [Serratia symbiotica]QLH64258.1 hypothetical protein SYMBAF_03670 [Serratia symbiotica]